MKPIDASDDGRSRRGAAQSAARALAGALACLAAQACSPGDPLDSRVEAGDYVTYSMWRSGAAGRLTPLQLADLDEAVQEMRFHVMAEGKVSGSAAIEDEMLRLLNGRTVRGALQVGLGWELERAAAEKSALDASMRQNALMRTKPGDTASADYLADLSDRQATRLKAAADQVDHVRGRLAAEGLAASGR
jgi:hypothetical protein